MALLCSFARPHRAFAARAGLVLGALAGLWASPALLAADSKGAGATQASSRSQLTAEQIVEKHVAARGGLQAWRSLQALSVSGKMEAGSSDSIARSIKVSRSRRAPTSKLAADAVAADKSEAGKQVQLPFVMELKRPAKSRVEIEFAGKTAVQVYDGKQGWKLRPYLNRDDVEPFTDQEAKSEADRGDMEGPLVDYAAKGTKVALEKIEPVEGHDAYKLKLTLKNGRVQHAWIDTQSFLDVKIDGIPRRMDGRMHDVWIYQRDFRKVDGLMMPFVLETAVDGYPGTHKMLIEKAAVNPKLDDARFAKPKA
jgi:outer membrane lipoprotein-sorting protein